MDASKKTKSTVRDMTEGSPFRHIVGFAIPMLLGILLQQLYNVVDAIVVGRILGVDALAGVGATSSLNFVVMGLCMGLGSGFALPVATSFGARDYGTMRKYVGSGIWLSVAICAIMTLASACFCGGILRLMGTPEEIFEYSYRYIVTIFLGIPVMYAYNYLAGLIRALGDSKTPVYFLMLSTFLNILLDLFSVLVLNMGVMGPAISTVASQGISVILCYLYIQKRLDLLRMNREELRPDRRLMGRLLGVGLPMGIQYSITGIGSLVMTSAVNSLGSAYVAAHAALGKVGGFLACPLDALGGTMANYVGQNVGAKRLDRIKKGVAYAMLIGGVYSILVFLTVLPFGDLFATVFVDARETLVIESTHWLLILNTMAYVLLTAVNVFRFSLQGLGYSALAMTAGMLEMVGRTITGFFIVPAFGFVVVGLSSPLAWILASPFLIVSFYVCCNRLKRKWKLEEADAYAPLNEK